MKNLENLGVQELTIDETQNVDGGIVFSTALMVFAIGVAIGAGIGVTSVRR